VMAAAVADYRPAESAEHKVKKAGRGAGWRIELTETPDILAMLVSERRPGQVIVGFAAETGDSTGSVRDHGVAKLRRKGCDLLVVNDVSGGRGFDSEDNAAVILASDGSMVDVPHGPKDDLADAVWDLVVKRLPPR
jgi:phosphopantothenoylcysteine decarboxylase/phosphopantothenate--cysteine ligase